MVLLIEDTACSEMNFWVNSEKDCSELNVANENIGVSQECSKQQGFICEIICSTPHLADEAQRTTWNCEEENLECSIDCKKETILIGSDIITCTNIGWVTNTNKTTYIPYCHDENAAIKDMVDKLHFLTSKSSGVLFIVDESYSVTIPEWWIQLQFVASMIQVLPISANLSVGVLMFSGTVSMPVPYNATDTCS
ncbi:hypothetical protein ILUMI_16452, partial [Ignelater luminosus]